MLNCPSTPTTRRSTSDTQIDLKIKAVGSCLKKTTIRNEQLNVMCATKVSSIELFVLQHFFLSHFSFFLYFIKIGLAVCLPLLIAVVGTLKYSYL
jgi:hypothetical protein